MVISTNYLSNTY